MGVVVLATFVFFAVRYKTLGIAGILSQLIAVVLFMYSLALIPNVAAKERIAPNTSTVPIGAVTAVGITHKIIPRTADGFHSPFDIPNMSQAVETISYVMETDGKVLIYGDYDADG